MAVFEVVVNNRSVFVEAATGLQAMDTLAAIIREAYDKNRIDPMASRSITLQSMRYLSDCEKYVEAERREQESEGGKDD